MCDLTKDSLEETVPRDSVDVVSMFFVLSAISPEKMTTVLQNILAVSVNILAVSVNILAVSVNILAVSVNILAVSVVTCFYICGRLLYIVNIGAETVCLL